MSQLSELSALKSVIKLSFLDFFVVTIDQTTFIWYAMFSFAVQVAKVFELL